MACRKAKGSLGCTTKPVSLAILMNEVPVPISLEINGLPYMAPSNNEMPKASERKCEGNSTA
jgi:hypothetical protein